MYRRTLLFIVIVAVILAVAVWFADHPGAVDVRWLGWRIQTTLPVAAAIWLLGWVLLAFLWHLVTLVVDLPGRLVLAHRQKRTHDGYQALSDGLAALVAGDNRQAERLAKRADKLLEDRALTGLLSAQVAEQAGEETVAEDRLRDMTLRSETAFLGYRGLLNLAMKRGDRAAALDYARQAFALQPAADGLVGVVLDLLLAAKLWTEARTVLKTAGKNHSLSGAALLHYTALIQMEEARTLQADGDIPAAATLALKAHRSDPMLVPAAVLAAGLLKQVGKVRRAKAALITTWEAAPQPALVEAWLSLWGAETPLDKVKYLEQLVKINPQAVDGYLALGEAALSAKLWGTARENLLHAAEQQPGMGVYLLLARLEREENQNEASAQLWLSKAMEAPAEQASWRCEQCHKPTERWSLVCPHCGAVDRLVWHR